MTRAALILLTLLAGLIVVATRHAPPQPAATLIVVPLVPEPTPHAASRSYRRPPMPHATRRPPTQRPPTQRPPTHRPPTRRTQLNWRGLARCESTNNPRAIDPSGTYFGLYQFDLQTWASVGGTGSPADAPASEQTYRAELLYAERGRAPWPVCGRFL